MIFKEYNEEYGRNEFGRNMNELLKQSSAVESVIMAHKLDIENIPTVKAYKSVQSYLDSSFTDKRNLALKKIYAAAVVAAKDKNLSPELAKIKSPVTAASVVDNALHRLKVAHQLGTGRIDAATATERLIDKGTTRFTAVTDKLIDHGLPWVAGKLVDVAASVCPPVRVFKPVVQVAAKYVAPAVKKFVSTGIKVVGEMAKTVVRGIAEVASGVISLAKREFDQITHII
ncbi:MAG: hypothetical protein MR215_04220 [Bacteroidales bacterium]|nr:hypothetical protein [Bacteroidales bacterium]MDY4174306.1 hypothetical protein [Bacteroidales bacterium]